MHDIEPFYNWRELYIASEDENSPFYERENSEVYYEHTIYNHWIHPQWDYIGSSTLYLKLLFADYERGFCVIELFGEWNDVLHNDIMYLKRNVVDVLLEKGINKYILIAENVLIFHPDDDSYYQEWYDEVEEGWIAGINFRKHLLDDFSKGKLDYYIALGGELNNMRWRTVNPYQLFEKVDTIVRKRISLI